MIYRDIRHRHFRYQYSPFFDILMYIDLSNNDIGIDISTISQWYTVEYFRNDVLIIPQLYIDISVMLQQNIDILIISQRYYDISIISQRCIDIIDISYIDILDIHIFDINVRYKIYKYT